jgi:hypothetical protein
MRTSITALAALLITLPGALGAQQNLFPEGSIVGGVEVRQYSFGTSSAGNHFAVDRIRQIAVPLGAVVPLGKRFSFDVGSSYAVTTVRDTLGGSQSFSGLTDAQVRGSYVFGNDALVASVMVNLPIGKETTTLSKFGISSAASSNFLLFPVNSYGSGFSVTPGLAAATTAGSWNLGLAGSVRLSAKYNPFSDNGAVSYKPGLETRLRAGADRLIGSSRLSLGFTFSTFSNDQLRGGGFGGNGVYDPGNRFLVDASLQAAAGSGTISFYGWNYYRTASNSTSGAASNRENVLTLGTSGSFPLGAKLAIEPVLEARIWSPKVGSGTLFGAGASLHFEMSPRVSLVPGGRIDVGNIKGSISSGAPVTSHSITSWDLSALVRYAL